jgi:hypothetical protein
MPATLREREVPNGKSEPKTYAFRVKYFAVIRAALRDCKPMEQIFSGLILRGLRGYEKQQTP